MLRHQLHIAFLLALGALPAAAQINSPAAPGYLARAEAMASLANYEGATHQLATLLQLHPTASETEEGQRLAALAALAQGRDEALTLINEWMESYPASPYQADMQMARGDYWFARMSYANALSAYQAVEAEALSPMLYPTYLYRLSYSRMLLAQWDEAARGFEQVGRYADYAEASHFYQGYIAYRQGRYAEALDQLNQAGSGELGVAAMYYRAQIYFAQGDYAKAAPLARQLVDARAIPEFQSEAARVAGESLYNIGRDTEARPYLELYAKDPDASQPSAFYILGQMAYSQQDYTATIEYLRRVVGLDDAMGQSAYLTLGQAYVKTGNLNSALMAFDKAYKIDYDLTITEAALYNYAVARMDGGRVPFGNSVALLEDFLRRFPTSSYASEVQEYIIAGYLTDNDYENALRSINAMTAPSAKALAAKQRVLYVLATRDYSAGNLSQALTRFSEAATLPDDNSLARTCQLWQATCLYDLDQPGKAADLLTRYIKDASASDPNLTLARYDLGYAYYADEGYAKALSEFKRVMDASDASQQMKADAAARAGDCLYFQNRWDEAATYYQRAYDLNPSSADYALYQIAIMKGLQRRHREKIDDIDRLIATYPSSGLIAAAMLEKAESYAALGEQGQALKAYQELVDRYPATSYGRNGMLQMAITLNTMGQRDKAIDTYRQVITTYPSSEEARLASDDLKRIYADEGRLSEYMAFIQTVPNAPQVDTDELDTLAFQSAENLYITADDTSRLTSYLNQFPSGAYRPQAYYYMAQAAAAQGQDRQAIEWADKVITSYPDASVVEDALLVKAEAQASLGMGERALDTYRQLQQRASGAQLLQAARLGVMRQASALGRHGEALEAADQLLATSAATNTYANEIHYTHAAALAALGRPKEAETEWKTLAANPADLYGSMSAVAQASSLLDRGEYAAAQKAIDAFINANPPHQYWLARGFIVLSDALRAQGNDFEADEYLRSLRSNYPGNEQDIFNLINQRLPE
ncbi:MAG: tetratricopeptide repeat protein [Bacteroidales bacterium]|nr:tetratricopeptide repeat protein [Bacteroidales bacterium]